MTDLPALEDIRSISAPVQVFAWADDHTHPVSTAQKLHRAIPGCQLRIAETPEDLQTWPAATASFLERHS
ncbi:hypothetical protein [Nesterenkonia pannonica]|nr:hypothetical protein [Nesterenkonia pannonica]